MAKNFCCCGNNLKAAKILAIVFIVLRLIQIALSAYALANLDYLFEQGQYDGDDKDQVKLIMQIGTGLQGFFLIIDICLLVGSIKKIPGLLWVWLVVAGISVIYVVVSGIITFTVLNIVMAVISALLTVWAMLAVYGAVQEIKEEIQAERDYYKNQEF